VLVRLASAFDLTMAGLMLRAEGQGERISRAVDQQVWRDPETGYLRRQVFSRPDNQSKSSGSNAGQAACHAPASS